MTPTSFVRVIPLQKEAAKDNIISKCFNGQSKSENNQAQTWALTRILKAMVHKRMLKFKFMVNLLLVEDILLKLITQQPRPTL